MRKWISAAAVGMALMALVSCGKSDHFDPNTLEQSTVGELSSDVTMRLSQEEFRSVPSELSLVITNHTGEEYTYGSEYRLEVYLDDQWYILPAEEELYFTSIGVMLQPDGINSENIAPEEYREHLPAGHYRVVKEFYGAGGEITAAAEFSISA